MYEVDKVEQDGVGGGGGAPFQGGSRLTASDQGHRLAGDRSTMMVIPIGSRVVFCLLVWSLTSPGTVGDQETIQTGRGAGHLGPGEEGDGNL